MFAVVVTTVNGGTTVVVVVETVPVDEAAGVLPFMLVLEMSNSSPPTQFPHYWL